MKHMIEFSRHKHLKTVQGQVLSENTTMLAMCAELGFHIADDPDDPGAKTVTLPVRTAHGKVGLCSARRQPSDARGSVAEVFWRLCTWPQ